MGFVARTNIAKRLLHSEDFKYLFLKRQFSNTSDVHGTVSKAYGDSAFEFVSKACSLMSSFPARVANDSGRDATEDELNEVTHYLIDWLYLAACVDMLVGNLSDPQKQIEYFSYHMRYSTCTWMAHKYIYFSMYNDRLGDEILIKINMPQFTITEFENFNTIQDFMLKSKLTIDVCSPALNLTDAHTILVTQAFMQNPKEYLAKTIETYVKNNNLM